MTDHWWLSFADPDKPKGQTFLGVAIVPIKTDNVEAAVDKAWELDCNPGGEVLGQEFDATSVPDRYIGRLLSQDETNAVNSLLATKWRENFGVIPTPELEGLRALLRRDVEDRLQEADPALVDQDADPVLVKYVEALISMAYRQVETVEMPKWRKLTVPQLVHLLWRLSRVAAKAAYSDDPPSVRPIKLPDEE
jgi:hypothetical protein